MGPRCYITDCPNEASLIIPAVPDTVVVCDEHRWIIEGNPFKRWAEAHRAARETAAAAGVPDAVELADASSDLGRGLVEVTARGLVEASRSDRRFPRPVATEPDLYDPAELLRWQRSHARRRRAGGWVPWAAVGLCVLVGLWGYVSGQVSGARFVGGLGLVAAGAAAWVIGRRARGEGG